MHGASAGALIRQPLRSCHRGGEESSSGRRRASWRRCARGDDGDPIKPEKPLQWRRIAKLETNIDDCSPQVVAFAQERLMKAGALDCYTTPIFMKKVGASYRGNTPGLRAGVFLHVASVAYRRLARKMWAGDDADAVDSRACECPCLCLLMD